MRFPNYRNWYHKLRKVFVEEETRFMMSAGLKISGISLMITGICYFVLFQVLRLNYGFFKANGFPQFSDDSLFYDSILSQAVDILPVLLVFHVSLFFIGVYVGWVILRPFQTMGLYCEKVIENKETPFSPEQFTSYSLFIRFSEFFFEYLRESRKKNEIISNSIPPQYSKIHRPVADKIFMLHFGLLLIIISICGVVFVSETTEIVYSGMVELAEITLKNKSIVNRYFLHQQFILDELVYLTIFMNIVAYLSLGIHLYDKVSGAAFGIFSTMRAFMKGNYSSRVHLVGYAHVREHTRKLNKYLDYIQNNLTDKKIR